MEETVLNTDFYNFWKPALPMSAPRIWVIGLCSLIALILGALAGSPLGLFLAGASCAFVFLGMLLIRGFFVFPVVRAAFDGLAAVIWLMIVSENAGVVFANQDASSEAEMMLMLTAGLSLWLTLASMLLACLLAIPVSLWFRAKERRTSTAVPERD